MLIHALHQTWMVLSYFLIALESEEVQASDPYPLKFL